MADIIRIVKEWYSHKFKALNLYIKIIKITIVKD
jgi:hypothetical protein